MCHWLAEPHAPLYVGTMRKVDWSHLLHVCSEGRHHPGAPHSFQASRSTIAASTTRSCTLALASTVLSKARFTASFFMALG